MIHGRLGTGKNDHRARHSLHGCIDFYFTTCETGESSKRSTNSPKTCGRDRITVLIRTKEPKGYLFKKVMV